MFVAIKINYVWPDLMLSSEFQIQEFFISDYVPKYFFCLGLFFSSLFCLIKQSRKHKSPSVITSLPLGGIKGGLKAYCPQGAFDSFIDCIVLMVGCQLLFSLNLCNARFGVFFL